MHTERSVGELYILHGLRDGDDPALSTPASQIRFFERDVARLVALGFVQRDGPTLALTLDGLNELRKPCNFLPVLSA